LALAFDGNITCETNSMKQEISIKSIKSRFE
jgi:hypothetical protein